MDGTILVGHGLHNDLRGKHHDFTFNRSSLNLPLSLVHMTGGIPLKLFLLVTNY